MATYGKWTTVSPFWEVELQQLKPEIEKKAGATYTIFTPERERERLIHTSTIAPDYHQFLIEVGGGSAKPFFIIATITTNTLTSKLPVVAAVGPWVEGIDHVIGGWSEWKHVTPEIEALVLKNKTAIKEKCDGSVGFNAFIPYEYQTQVVAGYNLRVIIRCRTLIPHGIPIPVPPYPGPIFVCATMYVDLQGVVSVQSVDPLPLPTEAK